MQTVLEVLAAIFAIVAAWFLYAGFTLEVTVPTDVGAVANAQLMHIQATNTAIGIGASIVSAILLAGAGIIGSVRKAAQPD